MLGDEGYAKFLKTSAEVIEGTDTAINHFLPELSNAPEQVAAIAPEYWRPKTMAAKAGTAKSPAVNAAEKSKMDDKDKH
jgi:hypothetical protein